MDDQRTDRASRGSVGRGFFFGCIGMFAGFYAVALVVVIYQRIATGGYDPSIGMAVGVVAMPTGGPLGFLLGYLFGRRRKEN